MKILKYEAMFENQTVVKCSTILDKNAFNRAFNKIRKIAKYEGPIAYITFEEVEEEVEEE